MKTKPIWTTNNAVQWYPFYNQIMIMQMCNFVIECLLLLASKISQDWAHICKILRNQTKKACASRKVSWKNSKGRRAFQPKSKLHELPAVWPVCTTIEVNAKMWKMDANCTVTGRKTMGRSLKTGRIFFISGVIASGLMLKWMDAKSMAEQATGKA